jgi:hypothetical protein
VSYLKSSGKGRDLKLRRLGSKITYLKFLGIEMAEAKKLLAPGFSLSSMASMCGLEESKAVFPFEKFNSREFLELPSLPPKAEDWVSSLDPTKAPSQQTVDEALETFARLKCQKIKDFLIWYLRLDVILLLKAVVKLGRGFYSTLAVSPVDSRKYTISSLVTYAAQMRLMRDKRPAQFFCNDSVKFSVRRKKNPERFLSIYFTFFSFPEKQILKTASRGGKYGIFF